MLQKILSLIDNAEIAEAFAEIDKANIQSPSIAQLKREFILGDKRFDFYDRLKMAVREELSKENVDFQNKENQTIEQKSIDLLKNIYLYVKNKCPQNIFYCRFKFSDLAIDETNHRSLIHWLRKEKYIKDSSGFDYLLTPEGLKFIESQNIAPSHHSGQLKSLYNILNQKLNDENLNLFCQLHFAEVHDNFSLGQSKTTKISALLDFAKRKNLLEKLEKDLQDF